MRLDGKRAFVTGSGRGSAGGSRVRLAREGADVVIDDVDNEDEARAAKAEIEGAGRRGLILRADISRVDEARRLIDEAVRQIGTARYPRQQRRGREAGSVRRCLGGGL